jgi:tubulin polyglutamylase TTLL2
MSSEETLIFRQESMPQVVYQTLQRLGWEEHDDEVHAEDEWNIFWKPTRPTMGEYYSGKEFQKHIHFPKTGILCKKDSLARLIKKNRNMFGKIYDFSPITYFLPNEYKKFIEAFTRAQTNGEAKTNMWICKPTDSSRGRGISIINDISNL